MADEWWAETVHRARRGDREAFGRLVDRFRGDLQAFAYHLTGDAEAARDLTQEAFVKAYLALAQLSEPTRFPGWLRRIAANLHRGNHRHASPPALPLDAQAMAVNAPTPATPGELAVHEALSRLREADRQVLSLHYLQGYTQAELATCLGTTPAAAKMRVARARARLRKELLTMDPELTDARPDALLPAAFRRDVLRAVDGMVRDLRDVLPEDLSVLAERLRRQRNYAWRDLQVRLQPAPLAVQGEARRVRVGTLQAELQEAVRQAMHLTWLDECLSVFTPPPWIPKPEVLWLTFRTWDDGALTVRLADTAGDSGWIYNGIALTDEVPATSPGQRCGEDDVARRDVAQLVASLADDVIGASRGLRTALLKALPAEATALRAELEREMRCRFLNLHRLLDRPPGSTMPFAGLGAEAQELARRAVTLHWAVEVVSRLAEVPSWIQNLPDAEVEFGLYPSIPELGPHADAPYVHVHGPTPGSGYQTCIKG